MNITLKAFAVTYALFGAMFVTVGIGNTADDAGLLSVMLLASGALLLSASLILWTRR
jgi:hypothetical protein